MALLSQILHALLMAAGMFWQVGWSLVLGFTISAALQVLVPSIRLQATLGNARPRAILLASLAGIASSSCSYASAAISRTLFKKGAHLIPALAFLLASTNLVVELGIVLYLLLGWQFVLAEWLGGVLLIIFMALLVKLTYPQELVEAARVHPEAASQPEHDMAVPAGTWWHQLRQPTVRGMIAQNFVMDARMLWKDLALGFLIAGSLATFVPPHWWQTVFLSHQPEWLEIPANALLGPLVAIISFVCSIGNVPLAAVLWGAGVDFGGVLAFLFADLLVLPLLDVYRRYYGVKLAAYIGVIFYATMVLAALAMELVFRAGHLIPARTLVAQAAMVDFSLDYTFWLNLVFGAVAVGLVIRARRAKAAGHAVPVKHCCGH